MPTAFDPLQNHAISRTDAAVLIQAQSAQAAPGEHLATVFNRSAFERILAQAGCAGIRVYRARHADGTPTLVLVGVDADGQDLATEQSEFAQFGTNCPPFCPSPWFQG
ncbi:MAG TPA: hypothetical protein VJ570_12880 [Holophagaceae bacterium]|nr:hypothetical protein [Holophagaceae bacterium]